MLDRKSAPAFLRSTSYYLPQPEKLSVRPDQKIWFLPSTAREVVRVEVVFSSGKYYESFPGVSHFTAHMLEKGTLTHDAAAINKILDRYGAHLEVHPGLDHVSLSLYSTTNNLNQVLAVFLEIITEPSFPEKELELLKSILIENLKINEEKNSYLASKYIRRNFFGSHPYGGSLEVKDAELIQVAQLADFYKSDFQAMEIFIVGNIHERELHHLVDQFPKSFPNDPPKHTLTFSKPYYETFEKPSSLQSSLRLAKPGLPMNHADYPAFLTVNHLLGGFFGSRLMKNIREEKGLSYGIYSSISHLVQSDFITIGADVNREKREIAVAEIRNELKNLGRIRSPELEIVKNHLIGIFQNELNTIFAVGDKIKAQYLFNLDPDFFHRLIIELDRLTLDQLELAAVNHFKADDFFVVVVG